MWSVRSVRESKRVRSVRESDLWGRGSPKWEADRTLKSVRPICEAVGVRGADRPLTHTGRCSPILGAAWLISRLNALLRPVESDRCAWEADRHLGLPRPHRSVRPIGLSNLWGRSVRPIGLSDRSHDFLVRGRARTPTASQIGLTDLRVRSASHAHRAMQSDPRGYLTDFTAKRIASAGVRERPIGLSNLWGRGSPWLAQTGHMRNSVRPRRWEAVRGWKWEAVRGRERPCSSHWLRDLCQRVPDLLEPIRAPRPHTASHGLPNSASQTYKIHRISNFRQQ